MTLINKNDNSYKDTLEYKKLKESNEDMDMNNKWLWDCGKLDINNMEDLLENMDIKTEHKWSGLICKDIENIIGDMIFDKINYFHKCCNGDIYLYREVDTIFYKNGRIKEKHIQRCKKNGDLIKKRWGDKIVKITLRKNGKYKKYWKEKGNQSCSGFEKGWRLERMNKSF